MVSKLTNNVKPLDEVDKINEIIDELDNIDPLPSQTGQSGKYLTTNGTVPSWADVNSLPSQTGKAGLYLQTDGTDASWEGVPGRNIGEIVSSTIPLTDAGLHLLDGSLIQGSGIYSAFVDYIAELYEADPTASYFASNEIPWVQPVLNANGTLGGDSFAVSASSEYNSSLQAYMAFDSSNTSEWCCKGNPNPTNLIIYNPTPIKISKFRLTNRVGYTEAFMGGNLYGSNDNSNWALLTTFTNPSSASGASYDINLNISAYYKYYKFEFTSFYGENAGISNIAITATYQSSAEQWWQSQVTQYGVCGKFVYDSVNNTVRLPKVTGIIEGTTDVTALGDLVEAGLPDHTHSITIPANAGWNGTNYLGSSDRGWVDKNFIYTSSNASDSNPIYGNSSTVQPQTIKAFYYIVIATSTKTDIQVDIDEIATDLNGKVDKSSLQEVQCVVETYVNGKSGYRIYSDGYCVQWGDFGGVFSSWTTKTVTFLKPFKDTNYTIFPTMGYTSSSNFPAVSAKTTTTFTCYTYDSTGTACWQASGYIEV